MPVKELERVRRAELAAWIQRSRRPGEPFLSAVAREVICGLAEDGWDQVDIGKALGISQRVVNYWCEKYQIRPKDRRLLRALKGGAA